MEVVVVQEDGILLQKKGKNVRNGGASEKNVRQTGMLDKNRSKGIIFSV